MARTEATTLEGIETQQAIIDSLLRENVRFDLDLDESYPKIRFIADEDDAPATGFTGRGKSGRSTL